MCFSVELIAHFKGFLRFQPLSRSLPRSRSIIPALVSCTELLSYGLGDSAACCFQRSPSQAPQFWCSVWEKHSHWHSDMISHFIWEKLQACVLLFFRRFSPSIKFSCLQTLFFPDRIYIKCTYSSAGMSQLFCFFLTVHCWSLYWLSFWASLHSSLFEY